MVEINRINFAQQKEEKLEDTVEIKKVGRKKKIIKIFAFLGLGLVLLFLIASIGFMVLVKPLLLSGKETYATARELYNLLKVQDLTAAEEQIMQTQQSLAKTKSLYKRFFWSKYIPLLGVYYKDGEHFLQAGEIGLEAGQSLIKAITPYADILGFKGKGSFTGGTAEDRIAKMVETLSKISPKFEEIGEKMEEMDKQLNEVNPNRYPSQIKGIIIREKIVEAKELLHDATLALTDARPVLEVLPSVLGYPDTKRYLALFQNDGELRATGGFMTAYGVLRAESGRIRAEKSDDIYSLDKKFNSRLEPPEPIAKYLLSADLNTGIVPYFYLRDMNFWPDFRLSMETFLPNYQKIKGEPEVDGIIAMDTEVLKDLVEILGPIDVPGYGEFNLEPDERCFDIPQIICELEHIADVPIPGVKVARKDVLGPMMQEMILKAMGTPKNVWPNLFKTVIENIKQKHILFYLLDEEAQEAAEIFGAAGRIKDYDGDYLHVNDSNFGGAKSNLFVEQEVEKEVSVGDDGRLLSTLTLTYSNPTPMSDCSLERKEGLCLNGVLRDYLRVYVPKGSKLIEGLGSEEEFGQGEELGKTFFEGFFTLRGGGGRAKVVLRYELPESVKIEDEYRLLIQKQPGTKDSRYKIKAGGKEEEFDLMADKEVKMKVE